MFQKVDFYQINDWFVLKIANKRLNVWAVSSYFLNFLFDFGKIDLPRITYAKFHNKIRIPSAICALIWDGCHSPCRGDTHLNREILWLNFWSLIVRQKICLFSLKQKTFVQIKMLNSPRIVKNLQSSILFSSQENYTFRHTKLISSIYIALTTDKIS